MFSCRRREVKFILETKKLKPKNKTNPVERTKGKGKPLDETKFENYFDFKIPVNFVKPHQVKIIFKKQYLFLIFASLILVVLLCTEIINLILKISVLLVI